MPGLATKFSYGLGIGCGFQTSNLPAQNVLRRADVPLGMALMFFMQQLGGSALLAVSQNLFASRLLDSPSGIARLNTKIIVNTGATALRTIMPSDQLRRIIHAYSYTLTRVFVLATVLSACMILSSLAVEWKTIKEKNATKGGPKFPDTVFEESRSDVKT